MNALSENIKKIIEDRINDCKKFVNHKIKTDDKIRGEAFQIYVVNLIMGELPENLGEQNRIDGCGKEFTIDFIFNTKDCTEISIFSIQIGKFNTDDVSILKSGITSIFFNKEKIINKRLEVKRKLFWKKKERIKTINIYCCSGFYSESKKDEFSKLETEIQNTLRNDYPEAKFNIFYITPIDLLNLEKKIISKKIGTFLLNPEDNFTFKYSYRNKSIKNAYISLVLISDLIKIYEKTGDLIFYLNIRSDVGKNRINKNIEKEMQSEYVDYFWCLNNGLTIVCDSFDRKHTEKPSWSIKNPMIINGQQTLRILSKNKHLKNRSILCKIIETTDINIIEKITETTNSQTSIRNQDLKSNHPLLIVLEEILKNYGIFIKRKRGPRFKGGGLNFDSKKVAQVIESSILKQPNVGRLGKDDILFLKDFTVIFSQDYKKIILSLLIYSGLIKCIKSMPKNSKDNINQFSWHILAKLWQKEVLQETKIDIDKKIEEYKTKTHSIEEINKIYQTINRKVPAKIRGGNNIGAYLNKAESLKILK